MPTPFHIRLTPLPHVRVYTHFEYDTEFFQKNLTPNIHFPHHLPYTDTEKKSHKDKYLLTALIQDENRKRINIYLKYPMEI